jgi:FAD/FMN-containing dehydrogenase
MADLSASLAELARTFSGRLLLPADAGYDEARRVHNGMIDKRPALVAQCRGAADVADAIGLARRHGLEIAVRGGGHNVSGRATIDGGLMIDLSAMRSVHVDRASRRARVDGGALWNDVNRETQLFGLAVTGGAVSTTGVAGLTLGGGFGWLMPKYGMALDNLEAVHLVTAAGEAVRASAGEHPDLFWAVRGGGGNFGVASSFEFTLHEVGPVVTGGLVAHPIDKARDVLRFFRDYSLDLPDDVFTVGALLTGPDGTRLAGIAVGHCGSLEDGARVVAPLKSFGQPVMDVIGPMPYSQINMMLDDAFPRGARNYWKSHFLDTLPDEAIDALVDRFLACPSPLGQIALEGFHGAATRVAPEATAYAMRASGFNTLILSQWTNAGDDAACIAWARESYAALQSFVGARRYLNYLDHDDVGDAALAAVYGPNLARLRHVKAQYDPENVFHANLNVLPKP